MVRRIPAWVFSLVGLVSVGLFVALQAASSSSVNMVEGMDASSGDVFHLSLVRHTGQAIIGLLPVLLPLTVLALVRLTVRHRSPDR